MTEPATTSEIQLRAVRLWLLAAAAIIFLTLIVGGATRLTESGLSIVEWKPIAGVLPPLSENNGVPNSRNTRPFRNIRSSIAA